MNRSMCALTLVAGLCLGFLPEAVATDGPEIWTRQFGTASLDIGRAVAADATGVYVTGETEGALVLLQPSAGGEDAFLRHYDLIGDVVWTRQFGSGADDRPTAVAVDATGVYVAGSTEGTLPEQTSAGLWDAFVRKYDLAGNHLWTRQFGTAEDDQGTAVAIDASGVYVAGHTWACLPGQAFCESGDAFVRKYDLAGNHLWTRQFGTADVDEAHGVAVDSTGVYVAGTTDGVFPGQTSTGTGVYDAFLAKLDLAGNQVWARQIYSTAGTGFNENGWAVAVGVSGVYVAGSTTGLLPGQTCTGFEDAFVRQYDQDGGEGWTSQICGLSFGNETARGVAVDASGVYVAGDTGTQLPGLPYPQGQDGFVRKYNHAGYELWTRGISGVEWSREDTCGVALKGEALYVTGSTQGTLPSQPANLGSADAFVRNYEVEPGQIVAVFQSAAAHDGWVRESEAGSGKGGSLEAAETTARVGDDATDRQYRTVLSFDTSSLPDTAIVVEVTVRVRRQGLVGGNPFDSMGLLKVDIKSGWFHNSVGLEPFDFHAIGTRGSVGRFVKTPVDRWYRAPLRAPAGPIVNVTGVTQVRLRFEGSNLNGQADYLSLFTGEAPAASRPELVVSYYMP